MLLSKNKNFKRKKSKNNRKNENILSVEKKVKDYEKMLKERLLISDTEKVILRKKHS